MNIYFIIYLVSSSRVSCGLSWPQTWHAVEGGFNLLNFNPLPPRCWDSRCLPTHSCFQFFTLKACVIGLGGVTQWQSACLTCKGWVLPSTLKKKCIIISWGDPGQQHFPECWEEGRRGLWEQMEFSTWSLCVLRHSNQISHVTVRWLQVTDPRLRRSQAPRDSTWSVIAMGHMVAVGQRFSPRPRLAAEWTITIIPGLARI